MATGMFMAVAAITEPYAKAESAISSIPSTTTTMAASIAVLATSAALSGLAAIDQGSNIDNTSSLRCD